MHTAPQTHKDSNISGQFHLSRPPPPKELDVIRSKKIPTQNPLPLCPSHKQSTSPHHQCPYTRSPLAKPSTDYFSPISGPPPQADLCLDKLLTHLVSLNGTLQQTPEDHNPIPLEPSSPTTSGSTPSCTVSKSEPVSTNGQSTVSMASNRQLCPHIPIRYNETFLKSYMDNHRSRWWTTFPSHSWHQSQK